MTSKPLRGLQEKIQQALVPMMINSGYSSLSDGGFQAWRGECSIYVSFVITKYGEKQRIEPFSFLGFKTSAGIYRKFMLPEAQEDPILMDFGIDYAFFKKSNTAYIAVDNPDDADSSIEELRAFLLKEMLPCLEKYSNPRAIVSAYLSNEKMDPKSFELPGWIGLGTALMGLILAKFYGEKSDYSTLKKRYSEIIESLSEGSMEGARALDLIRYLEEMG